MLQPDQTGIRKDVVAPSIPIRDFDSVTAKKAYRGPSQSEITLHTGSKRSVHIFTLPHATDPNFGVLQPGSGE
jgi:hypothetical protein